MSDYDSDVEEGQELDLSNVRLGMLWASFSELI